MIQNGCVPKKKNTVPDTTIRNARPEAREEHGAPETILRCAAPSTKHAAPARTEMRCPQRDKMRRPGTGTRAVAGVSGTQTGTSAVRDDAGPSPDRNCDDVPPDRNANARPTRNAASESLGCGAQEEREGGMERGISKLYRYT